MAGMIVREEVVLIACIFLLVIGCGHLEAWPRP